jgi:hypothetical protein
MEYEVLSPWAEVELPPVKGLCSRVADFSGKTIGLFSFFKWHGPIIMKEVELKLKEKFPKAKFSHFHYPVEDVEVMKDDNYKSKFIEWLNGVDTFVAGHSD